MIIYVGVALRTVPANAHSTHPSTFDWRYVGISLCLLFPPEIWNLFLIPQSQFSSRIFTHEMKMIIGWQESLRVRSQASHGVGARGVERAIEVVRVSLSEEGQGGKIVFCTLIKMISCILAGFVFQSPRLWTYVVHVFGGTRAKPAKHARICSVD